MNLGRNDLYHCGSGKKYKRCCWDKDHGWFPPEVRAEMARRAHEEREQWKKDHPEEWAKQRREIGVLLGMARGLGSQMMR